MRDWGKVAQDYAIMRFTKLQACGHGNDPDIAETTEWPSWRVESRKKSMSAIWILLFR